MPLRTVHDLIFPGRRNRRTCARSTSGLRGRNDRLSRVFAHQPMVRPRGGRRARYLRGEDLAAGCQQSRARDVRAPTGWAAVRDGTAPAQTDASLMAVPDPGAKLRCREKLEVIAGWPSGRLVRRAVKASRCFTLMPKNRRRGDLASSDDDGGPVRIRGCITRITSEQPAFDSAHWPSASSRVLIEVLTRVPESIALFGGGDQTDRASATLSGSNGKNLPVADLRGRTYVGCRDTRSCHPDRSR